MGPRLDSGMGTPDPAAPEVVAEGLCKSFDMRAVLVDIHMLVERGQMVAVVGGSGSGKTVLLHLLAGLMPPTRGRVRVADHSRPGAPLIDLAGLGEDAIDAVRRHWAVVFQQNALFSGSVYENIALLLREHGERDERRILARARTALASVALDVDDVLLKDRDNLSGGMAKRVAIARAIAIDPALVFYDEPTTGLDPVVGAHIHELIWTTHLATTSAGVPRTSILVTHDKELLRRVRPHVVMLHAGRVCISGTYNEFEGVPDGPPREYLRAMPILHARQ